MTERSGGWGVRSDGRKGGGRYRSRGTMAEQRDDGRVGERWQSMGKMAEQGDDNFW